MITAKNYAAQVEKAIKTEMIPGFIEKGYMNDAKCLEMIASDIANSVHFVLPDDGKIFDDNLKGLRNANLRLPFERITVEYFTSVFPHKRLLLATQLPGGACEGDKTQFTIMCESMYFYEDCWNVHPLLLAVNADEWEGGDFDVIPLGSPKKDSPGIVLKPVELLRDWYSNWTLTSHSDAIKSAGMQVWALLEMLEALSCRNVSTANHQDIFAGNPKRIKAGKLPLYETKMLVVDTHYSLSDKSGNAGGSHASPRQHLRRGHIRRLESGNIWVNSCVVGDPNKGSINKQYSVV